SSAARRRIRCGGGSGAAEAGDPIRGRRARGVMVALLVLALAFLPMAFEARLAARHDRALRSAGATEPKDDVLPAMQLAYPASFLAMALECAWRGSRMDAVFAVGLTW